MQALKTNGIGMVQEVNLSKNSLDEEDFDKMRKMLATESGISSFKLMNNKMKDPSCVALFVESKSNQIKELDISGIQFTSSSHLSALKTALGSLQNC